jgi:hypothetical protein
MKFPPPTSPQRRVEQSFVQDGQSNQNRSQSPTQQPGQDKKRSNPESPSESPSFSNKRPKWIGSIEPRLDVMPKEIIEHILGYLPNGGEKSRVTSVALTNKALYRLAFEKTQAKAKSSALIDRAKLIGTIRANPAEFYEVRLAEFTSILGSATDPKIPLRGKDITDVFTAVAAEIDKLGFTKVEGFNLMLEKLEGLGRTWNKVTTRDPADRKEEIHQLDQTKNEILHLLSKDWLLSGFTSVQKGECFDRLHTVLESIETPEVKNKAATDLPLANWYFWHSESIGVARFGKLLKFVEDNLHDLTDSVKAKAVCKLMSKIGFHNDDADTVNDFNRLCGITESINSDDAKENAVTFLIKRRDWLPEGSVRTFAAGRLANIVDTIKDDVIRTRAAAVESVLQSP